MSVETIYKCDLCEFAGGDKLIGLEWADTMKPEADISKGESHICMDCVRRIRSNSFKGLLSNLGENADSDGAE